MATHVGQILKQEFASRRRTGGGSLSSPCIQTEPSSNVVHRTCRPSSTAIRFELHTELSLIFGFMKSGPLQVVHLRENRRKNSHTRSLLGCASVRALRRFLQEPRPRIFELRAPIAALRLVRAPGRMRAVDGPDPERPEQCGE